MHYRARSLDPRTGRFIQRDPVFGNRIQEAYTYAKNRPISLKDSTGRDIEPDKVATSQGLKDELNNYHAWQLWGREGVVWGIFAESMETGSLLREYLPKTVGKNRYLYTAKGGWIDLRHFTAAAASGTTGSRRLIQAEGLALEKSQAKSGIIRSAFSVEDMPSNKLGVDFADWLRKDSRFSFEAIVRGRRLLGDALVTFVNEQLGGSPTAPVGKIAHFNKVRSFGDTPVLESDLEKLVPKMYKPLGEGISGIEIAVSSSGNAGRDKEYLDLILEGFRSPRLGISGPDSHAVSEIPSAIMEKKVSK